MRRFVIVVLPEPVWPTSAMVSPGSAVNETSFKTQSSPLYANHTSRNSTRPRARAVFFGLSGVSTVTGWSSVRKMRCEATSAAWKTLYLSEMSRMGWKSLCEYWMKATSAPMESTSPAGVFCITRQPPYQMMSAMPSEPMKSTSGKKTA
jgi:hypothetical protein